MGGSSSVWAQPLVSSWASVSSCGALGGHKPVAGQKCSGCGRGGVLKARRQLQHLSRRRGAQDYVCHLFCCRCGGPLCGFTEGPSQSPTTYSVA